MNERHAFVVFMLRLLGAAKAQPRNTVRAQSQQLETSCELWYLAEEEAKREKKKQAGTSGGSALVFLAG